MIEKQCNVCEQIKPLSDFHKQTSAVDGHQYSCKLCQYERRKIARLANPAKWSAAVRKWQLANREKVLAAGKRQSRKRLYGVTDDDFSAMLVAQNYKCAICLTDTPSGKGNWHVDHDHTTGKVRGLLCSKCNTGLGLFNDSPARLQEAIIYLGKACD